MTGAPAYLRNRRRDTLATNQVGLALYSQLYADPARPVNVARYVFLNPTATQFFSDWTTAADDIVAALRTEAATTAS